MTPVVQFSVACPTQVKADQVLAGLKQYAKTRKNRARAEAEATARYEMDSGLFEVTASLAFESRNHAEQVYAWIVEHGADRAVVDGGVVSFHLCPEETPPEDWIGCNSDPRAEYQEVRFAG
jgi:hypothetical protein